MRPTAVEIDLSALKHNIQAIRDKVSPAKVLAVVKANAYGHGAIEVSKTVLANGADYLGVACIEEGIALRDAGIQAPILVLSSSGLNHTDLYLEYDLDITLYDHEGLERVKASARSCKKIPRIHVKIDTGMGRMGIHWQKAEAFIREIYRDSTLLLQGVYTHFATSDHIDKSYALLQAERFKQILSDVKAAGIAVPLAHGANSGAILDLPETYFDMVRPGILMYGHYPSDHTTESVHIKPVMEFKTRVLYTKALAKGESVSYDRIFIADRDTRVATLPVGYEDGYNRLLSNCGEVLIQGRRFPVIGRVTMDMIVVDLGDDTSVQEGDEVVLFGKQDNNEITVESICEKINTIPYEVICWVSNRVQRIYINSEEL